MTDLRRQINPTGHYTPDTRQRLSRATRFFARLEAFTLECPRCGKVYRIRLKEDREGRRVWSKAKCWDPLTSRFTCQVKSCERTYILGIVAWPVGTRGGTATPEDQVPNIRQLAQMRAEGGGWWIAEEGKQRHPRPITTNVTLEPERPEIPEGDDDEEV